MGDQHPSFLPFGLMVIFVLGAFLLVPVLRRRQGLLSARSLILLGGIIYFGVGSIEAYATRLHYRQLDWFNPTQSEVFCFYAWSFVFWAAFLLIYRWFPSTQYFSRLALSKTPPISFQLAVFVIVACMATILIGPLLRPVPVLGEVMINFAQVAVSVGATFATAYWAKSRTGSAGLPVLLVVLAVFALEAMLLFHGRRILLSVCVAPVVVMYWMRWRSMRHSRVLIMGAGAAVVLGMGMLTYSTFRHYDSRTGEARSRAGLIARLRNLNTAEMQRHLQDLPHYFAQANVHFALLTMRVVDDGSLEVKPFESALHVVSYPIPRRYWSNKPKSLGKYFINGVLHLPNRNTVGLNVIGHAAAEGGVAAVLLYAMMIAALARFYDDALLNNPENPFVLACLAAAAPHLTCFVRGGVSTMTINCLEPLVMIVLLGFVARLVLGGSPSRTMTADVGNVPSYHS